MGLLSFSINLTLDGCVDHQEGIADEETHAFFTRLMDGCGAMLWGRTTYEMMESHWPAVARGEVRSYEGGLPGTRRLEMIYATPLRCGAVAMHYQRGR